MARAGGVQGHGAARVGEAGCGGPLPSLPGSVGRWSQRRSEVLKPGREFTAGADCPCTGERECWFSMVLLSSALPWAGEI